MAKPATYEVCRKIRLLRSEKNSLIFAGHCLIGCLTRYANEKSGKASKVVDLGMLALYPILVTAFLVSFFAFYGSMENVVDGLIPLH